MHFTANSQAGVASSHKSLLATLAPPARAGVTKSLSVLYGGRKSFNAYNQDPNPSGRLL
jgi:hypothetical protein